MVGESWSWKVTGISKLCLESFRKNKFEKSRKLKTKRRTIKNIVRHQLTNVDDTIKDIFITKRTREEWWDKILTEEKTHLVTQIYQRMVDTSLMVQLDIFIAIKKNFF